MGEIKREVDETTPLFAEGWHSEGTGDPVQSFVAWRKHCEEVWAEHTEQVRTRTGKDRPARRTGARQRAGVLARTQD